MEKTFHLEILDADSPFLCIDDAVSLTVTGIDGSLQILADHAPMVAALSIGEMVVQTPQKAHSAFHSEGFLKIDSSGVTVFLQAAEWVENIDENRARRSLERAKEQLLHRQNVRENRHTLISLARATTRLRIKSANHQSRP